MAHLIVVQIADDIEWLRHELLETYQDPVVGKRATEAGKKVWPKLHEELERQRKTIDISWRVISRSKTEKQESNSEAKDEKEAEIVDFRPLAAVFAVLFEDGQMYWKPSESVPVYPPTGCWRSFIGQITHSIG